MTDSDILKAQAALEVAKAEVAKREAELKEAQKAAKASVIAQIKDLMKQHDLKISDLGADNTAKKSKGVPHPARYFNPKNPSESWHGIGRPEYRPQWVKDILAAGDDYKNYKLEDRDSFIAKQAAATSNTAQSALGI
jgi:DNA-binding protein H-NS